jgi:6-pyruvoyltetrahydropterin/6-carboxytetrahydropterin synthase
MPYRIVLEKENFKFSASHFTVFGPTQAERLHGHNYYVSAELRLASVQSELGMAFDFNLIKPMIRELTDSLDEFVLLPEQSPWLIIQRRERDVQVTFANKVYVFPGTDVKLIRATNITSEELARHIAESLSAMILSRAPEARHHIQTISIGVEETRGQTVFYELDLA